MKRFEITFIYRDKTNDTDGFKAHTIDKIESDNLSHLLSQFMMVIANIHRKITDKLKTELRYRDLDRLIQDDDIPF